MTESRSQWPPGRYHHRCQVQAKRVELLKKTRSNLPSPFMSATASPTVAVSGTAIRSAPGRCRRHFPEAALMSEAVRRQDVWFPVVVHVGNDHGIRIGTDLVTGARKRAVGGNGIYRLASNSGKNRPIGCIAVIACRQRPGSALKKARGEGRLVPHDRRDTKHSSAVIERHVASPVADCRGERHRLAEGGGIGGRIEGHRSCITDVGCVAGCVVRGISIITPGDRRTRRNAPRCVADRHSDNYRRIAGVGSQ